MDEIQQKQNKGVRSGASRDLFLAFLRGCWPLDVEHPPRGGDALEDERDSKKPAKWEILGG